LPHLLRAGCPDGPLGFMKIEAGLLKWQITIIKDTTNLTLEILDDILMLNA
jgi:hypothetical protein